MTNMLIKNPFFNLLSINSRKIMMKMVQEEVKVWRRIFLRSHRLFQFGKCALQADKLDTIIDRFPLAIKRTVIDNVFKNGVIVQKKVMAMAIIWINGDFKRSILNVTSTFA